MGTGKMKGWLRSGQGDSSNLLNMARPGSVSQPLWREDGEWGLASGGKGKRRGRLVVEVSGLEPDLLCGCCLSGTSVCERVTSQRITLL